MLGAVSANDLNSTDMVSEDSNVKDIYVSDIGDDDINTGSIDSPYATIGKAMSYVNGSHDATIHLSEGTFSSDNDVNFNINLNHKVYGGSLKFIGAGADKTFIDGQSSFRFAELGKNTNVIFKNLTFINFKAENGGTLYPEGTLTVDNCIFKNSYVSGTQGGAILANGEESTVKLYVTNSEFISCSVNGNPDYYSGKIGGGAISANSVRQLLLVNNTFSNNRITSGLWGVSVCSEAYGADIRNNRFINTSGDYQDGALWINVIEGSVNVINNTFINCSNPSNQYSIVYFSGSVNFEKNRFINSSNSVGCVYGPGITHYNVDILEDELYVGNDEINNGLSIQVNVTDDMGNKIFIGHAGFIVSSKDNNCSYILSIIYSSQNSYNFNEIPENGIYNVTNRKMGDTVLATCIVNISNEPVDLWVSPTGHDSNYGTHDNPFKTIQHAIDFGFDRSFNVIVHLLEGVYSGEDNVELDISNKGTLKIIGEKCNETIIDGSNQSWFLNANSETFVENIKFINGNTTGNLFSGGVFNNILPWNSKLYLENCIIEGNLAKRVLNNVIFNNLTYINNLGLIYFDWILSIPWNITNSYFKDNYGFGNGFIYTRGSLYLSNNVFVNNSASEYAGVLMAEHIVSENNYYEGNHASVGGVFAPFSKSYRPWSLKNDTFFNNSASSYGVFGYAMPDYSLDPIVPVCNFNNCSFIDNHADDGSVIGLDEGYFINCSFINNSALNHGAVTLRQGGFEDCLFLNNSASYGAAIVIESFVHKIENAKQITFSNVTFKDNFAKVNGHDLYFKKLVAYYLDYELNNYVNLTVNFNSQNVSSLIDNVSASVIGPYGAVVGGNKVTFKLDGVEIGSGEVVNGVATFKYSGFEDGEYELSGYASHMYKSSVINNGTVNVNLIGILPHREVWVSIEGSDEIGDGSINAPFKTISYAINQATTNSRDIVIHIRCGTYAGELNTMLVLSSMNNITLIGSGLNDTVIDGENRYYLAEITEGPNKIVFTNLTVKNMFYNQSSAIIVNKGANLYLSNVGLINCDGDEKVISNNGNLYVDNVVFKDNANSSSGLITGEGLVKINNVYEFSNFKGGISANTLIINNSRLDGFSTRSFNFICENTYFNGFFVYDGNVYLNNVSIILNNTKCEGYVSDGYIFYDYVSEMNVTAYNSSFYNFGKIWDINTYDNVFFKFDGCIFCNFTQLTYSKTIGAKSTFTISNSVFLNDELIVDRTNYLHRPNPNIELINCFWSKNSRPIVNFINAGDIFLTSSADKWIILTFENNVYKLQLTDGENISDYNGNLPLKVGYALKEGEMVPVVEANGIAYPILNDFRIDNLNPIQNPIFKPAADTTIFASDLALAYGDNARFTARFLYPWGDPLANTNVTYSINNRNFTVLTDENGSMSFDVTFDRGVYELIIYNPVSKQVNVNTIVVNKAKPKLTAANINTVYNDGKYLTVSVNAPGTVSVVLNGKTITKTVDSKGQVKIPITLTPKTYTAVITYNGNVNYAKASTTAIVKVTKATPKLTAKKATFKAKTKKYTITLKDNRNKAMKKVKVTLKVKGKTYKATTNAKGKATFKLTKLTKKGRYTAKVKFAGNKNFKAVTKSVKLTVK